MQKEPRSLRKRVNDFIAQRGLKVYSVGWEWTTTPSILLLLTKIGIVTGPVWTPRPDLSISDMMGDIGALTKFLNVTCPQKILDRESKSESSNVVPRLWLLVGTVDYQTTAKKSLFSVPIDPNTNAPFSGPTAHVLGSLSAVGDEDSGLATIEMLNEFDQELDDYMTGWALRLRKSKIPSTIMKQQMKKEICRCLVANFIASYGVRPNITTFTDSVSFPLAFSNYRQTVASGIPIASGQLIGILNQMMLAHSQEIIEEYVCSDQVQQPEYLRGGQVRLPVNSPICKLKLNGKSLRSGKLFQEFLQYQLDPEDDGKGNKTPDVINIDSISDIQDLTNDDTNDVLPSPPLSKQANPYDPSSMTSTPQEVEESIAKSLSPISSPIVVGNQNVCLNGTPLSHMFTSPDTNLEISDALSLQSPISSLSPLYSQSPLLSVSPDYSQSPLLSVSPYYSQSPLLSASPYYSQSPLLSASPYYSQSPLLSASPYYSQSPLSTSPFIIPSSGVAYNPYSISPASSLSPLSSLSRNNSVSKSKSRSRSKSRSKSSQRKSNSYELTPSDHPEILASRSYASVLKSKFDQRRDRSSSSSERMERKIEDEEGSNSDESDSELSDISEEDETKNEESQTEGEESQTEGEESQTEGEESQNEEE